MLDRKQHWEEVFQTKNPEEVSWTQQQPITSLALIERIGLDKDAPIIDVGAGDSNLVDYLLELGYENISVLDISQKAIEKAQKRLGDKSQKVQWIVSDILDFEPDQSYALWHDRAMFHFLTQAEEVETYKKIVDQWVKEYLILATFSTEGPLKCSGLNIQQFDKEKIAELFNKNWELVNYHTENHKTPFDTQQNFQYSLLQKKRVDTR